MAFHSEYFPEVERRSVKQITAFQEKKLKVLLRYLKDHSRFYSGLFSKNKIDISLIKSLKDLEQIPVTTKDHLQSMNTDFICVPKEMIIDYITTSGTMGDPVTFAMTDRDLERLAYNEAISFYCADGSPHEIYQLMTTIDRRFMAGTGILSWYQETWGKHCARG